MRRWPEHEGFDLSAGTLIAGFLVSTVGLGFFLYGKRSTRLPQLVAGLGMMIAPYFTHGATLTLSIGGVLFAGMWLSVRAGL